jgi:mevalonate kinase
LDESAADERVGVGRACGKLILFGEHAVVHGTAAIVLGIDRGVSAEARVAGDGRVLSLLGKRCDAADGDEHARAFRALLDEGGAPPALRVALSGELPPGVGLGFSAAAAVAIARSVEALTGGGADEPVRARAMAWEGVYHGNPSGVDVAAAMHGGCTRFTRADRRSIPLAVGTPLPLAVGLTGTRSSTRTMVEGVAALGEREPEVFARSIEGIPTIVENATSALAHGELHAIGELMDLNQMLLAGLHVSSDTIEALCALARDAGALGAKLTGAGGGGAVVALASDPGAAAEVVAAWRARGYEGFTTELGESP